jgi:CspA family cold shock protein
VLRDVRLVVIDDAARMAGRRDLDRRLGRVLEALPETCQVVLVSSEDSPKLRQKAKARASEAEWVIEGELPAPASPAPSTPAERPAATPETAPTSAGSDGWDGAAEGTDGDRISGVVKWFNDSKGYGFLLPDGGDDDVFVHYSAIVGDGFRSLEEGGRVRFAIVETQKGPEATDVEPL